MTKIFFAVLVIVMSACSNTDTSLKEKSKDTTKTDQKQMEQPKTIAEYFKSEGDSIVVPAFDITIELSDKATQKLASADETIIVDAMFSGIPKDTTLKEYKEWGEYNLGDELVELTAPGTASFKDAKISKKDFDLLSSKDIQVLINVYSGRKSTGDNLLSCDILQQPISKVRLQKNILKGKLIGE